MFGGKSRCEKPERDTAAVFSACQTGDAEVSVLAL